MPKIFISYRRNDSATSAGRIFDRLEGYFGQGQVFMDVDTIRPGLDFVEVVQEAVGSCDALIAVIGGEWLGAADGSGRRRLENPEDLVRLEIAAALERDIRVIPVLVQGARMPAAPDLPEGLIALARRNSVEVSDDRFRTDIEQLIEALEAPTERLGDIFVEPALTTSSTFVGRDREMAELNKALDEALSGQGRLVMLAGEPGIGKTRIAQQLAAQAETLGAQVLWGRCYEQEGAPPYWPWVQPIRSYVQQADPPQLASEMGPGAADIADLVPEIRVKLPDLESPPALEPEQARFRLFDSITTFLKNAAASRPLIIVLDDLHWADRSSLLLLEFLVREMSGSKLLVIGNYRDVELSLQHPLSNTLAQLSREPVFRRELLGGFSQEDTQRFVESVVTVEPSQTLLDTIYARTEGNPFFMTEVLRLLSEQGDLASSETGQSTSFIIPEGVREVVGQRVSRLSERCKEVLTTASIIGREFDFRLLDALSDDLSEDLLGQVIDEAVDAHMLEEVPGSWERYRFSHALVQETLSGELSTRRKVRLHARIGQGLEELYGANLQGRAAELAHHFVEAEPVVGSGKLVHYSLLAGELALKTYAYEEALTYFERGLVAKERQTTDAEAAALLAGIGRIQVALGERHEMQKAVDTLIQAFDYYADAGDVERAVAVAQSQLPYVLGVKGKVQLLARALKLVPPDSQEAGSLLPNYGRELGMSEADYEGARQAFNQGLAIARRYQDTALELRILANSVHVDLFNLKFHECLEKGFRAIGLASRVADLGFEEDQARRYTTMSLLSIGDLERGRQQAEATLHNAEQLHQRSLLGWAEWLNAEVALLEGDWEKGRRHSDLALSLMPKAIHILAQRAHLECELGEFGDAETYLDCLLEVQHLFSPTPSLEFSVPAVLIPVMARIASRFDRFDRANVSADSVLTSEYALPRQAMSARAGLAIIAVQQGDSVACAELYAALKPQSGTLVSLLFLCADRLLGLLSHTMGNLDAAATHFEDALALCRKWGCRPELAWTCCDYADSLLQRSEPGDREKAKSLLDESLAISTEMGMRPLMERVIFRQGGLHA